jgi:SsrA-binding protein
MVSQMKDSDDFRYVAQNRKARHEYEIRARLEAGIELKGSEVKSLRERKVTLSDSYAVVENGEVILKNLHINPYEMAQESIDPRRPRRLLLHKREIRKLFAQTVERGLTLIPLAIYFKGKVAKIELAVAVGRKKYDKRQTIAKAEADRRIKRALRRSNR